MPKWTVRRQLLGDDWTVYRPDWPSIWYFPTWREAMAFAGEQARTIPVTLPAPVCGHPADVHSPAWYVSESLTRPWVATVGRYVSLCNRSGWGDHLDADTAEKLGLALLAAAKHAKGELS